MCSRVIKERNYFIFVFKMTVSQLKKAETSKKRKWMKKVNGLILIIQEPPLNHPPINKIDSFFC